MAITVKKTIETKIEITPEEVANSFWNYGNEAQVVILNILSTIDKFHKVEAQAEYVAMNPRLNVNAKELIKMMARVIEERGSGT